MSLHKRLLIILAFFYGSNLLSQGGISWEEATPICDPNSTSVFTPLPAVEDYDRTMYPASIEPCNSYFSFNINNPAWYTLQATSSTISMDISIDNCVGTGHGVGVQYAIVEIVDNVPVPVNCNSDANVGRGNNFTVGGLTVGNTYYLVLDGFAESVCEYSISNSSGFDSPDITETITGVIVNDQAGLSAGCRVNGVVKVSAVNASNNPIANANVYNWEISNISGSGFSTIRTTSTNSIELENIPPGDYQVTVRAGNACDNTQSAVDFNFTVDPNNLINLAPETVCLDDLSDEYTPTNPNFIGEPLSGLPNNPTRDTFYVEIPGGNCPDIQLLPLQFENGNSSPSRTIDTTTCSPRGVVIDGEEYPPRAAGSSPYFISQGGACANTIELNVTLFFADGQIIEEKCNTGFSTISFDPFFPENFEDVKEFASYAWFNEDGDVVSNEPTYPVNTSGSYSLSVSLQDGSNPSCDFDIPALFVDVSGISELEVECDNPTSTSVSIQWNDLQDIDSYAVAVEGRVIEESLTNASYTYTDITLGETVNFFVFANGNNPSCPPLMDSISCQALDCPSVDLVIANLGMPDDESLSICLDEDEAILADNLQFEVTRNGGAGGGIGRWLISSGGVLGSDDRAEQITINPNEQPPGEYVLRYRYQEGDCLYSSENVRNIEILRQPISTNLRRRGRRDIEDGVCVNDVLRLDYNGRAGSNAVAVWGGDITNADVTGDLDGGFEMTFTTPGTKNFTFMVMDDNGCNSVVAPYSIAVGEPLLPQVITCNSTAAGMEFTWADQDCVEEYQIFLNGRFETRINTSSYTYTRAVNGNSYSLEVEAISGCGCEEIDFSSASACMHTFDACDDVMVEVSINTDSLVCLDNDFASVKQVQERVMNQSTIGIGAWEVNTGNASISPEGAFDPVVAGPGIHQVKYVWTEGECIYADSLNIYVSEQINYGISVEDPLCFGASTGLITVEPQSGSGNYSILIDFIPQDSTLTVFPVDTGLHTLIVLNNVTGCDTLAEITINPGPDSLDLFRDTPYIILDGGTFAEVIDPSFAPLIDSLEWIYNGEIICDELSCGLDFGFEPLESGELCFTAYYSDCEGYVECLQIDYVQEFKVYLPNVISLSSDALIENKVFEVFTNDAQAVINSMLIFDRWGNQVYENNSEGSAMLWDPKLNGQTCSLGVYAYLIEITKGDGELEKKMGSLTIIK